MGIGEERPRRGERNRISLIRIGERVAACQMGNVIDGISVADLSGDGSQIKRGEAGVEGKSRLPGEGVDCEERAYSQEDYCVQKQKQRGEAKLHDGAIIS